MARHPITIRAFMLAIAALSPTVLAAQSLPHALSLSDDEKAALLAQNTETSVATARSGLGNGMSGGRQVHGVLGAMIGSNGTRGAFGTAAIPLGDSAGATVSFESSRYGGYRR